jgi:hypothetical protein
MCGLIWCGSCWLHSHQTAFRPVRRFAHPSYNLGLPFIRTPFQWHTSQRQAGLPPVMSWLRITPRFRDEALLAISTDRVQMLIYRAFRGLFERIRLIIRHPDRDPSQTGVALARVRGLDVFQVPLPVGLGVPC